VGRVQLRPGLQPIWRGPHTLQLGTVPGRATVLDGLTAADRVLLEQLLDGIELAELTAGRIPPGPARGHELIRLLDASDALVPARGRDTLTRVGHRRRRLESDAASWSLVDPRGDGWQLLARRSRQAVLVRGGGRLATAITVTLAAAGLRVRLEDARPVRDRDLLPGGAHVSDVGEPREAAARFALKRAGLAAMWVAGLHAPTAAPPPPGPPGPVADLVVLVEHGAADAGAALPLLRADLAHLSVLVRETDVLVGPLVRPGRGPCLRCLDLHRAERDPAWPRMLAQLLARDPRRADPEEAALVGLAAGLASLQVLGRLDGRAVPAVGATLEVGLPDGLVGRRPWPAHPACGCTWPPEDEDVPRVTPEEPPGPADDPGPGQDDGWPALDEAAFAAGTVSAEPASAEPALAEPGPVAAGVRPGAGGSPTPAGPPGAV
jgi:bacteriocin biosynthesis cyclodehydratase domain-containing protein